MTLQSFVLQPFSTQDAALLDLAITGQIQRQTNSLAIVYQIQGEVSNVVIPPKAAAPTRQHRLWESTCFECFLGPQQQDNYWEVNLAPTGDWNVYHFDRYRAGMQEEMAVTSVPFQIQSAFDLHLVFNLNLESLVAPEKRLDVAITAVIQSQDGTLTYWALSHTGAEADFHRRDSFTIEV